MITDIADRHPLTRSLARWFEPGHLPTHLQPVVVECEQLAATMIGSLPDGPELRAGLRALLGAKDWFVRALVTHHDGTAALHDPRYAADQPAQVAEQYQPDPAMTGVGSWSPPHGAPQLAGDGHYVDPAPMAVDPDPTAVPAPQHMAAPFPPAEPAGGGLRTHLVGDLGAGTA